MGDFLNNSPNQVTMGMSSGGAVYRDSLGCALMACNFQDVSGLEAEVTALLFALEQAKSSTVI